ncbi:protein of unknown function [Xenorhabdus nematophila AN6/1]|nr:protein of unknown function [Xenorhabdus nematophila AN6/1]
MSRRYVVEALLRPAVELNTALVAAVAAFVCIWVPWAIALTPSVSYVMAGGFAALAMIRTWQGIQVIRYRRNLRRLPRYQMSTQHIPVSHRQLFLGRGFRWQQKHTQRLQDTRRPEVERFVQPSQIYQLARELERRTEYRWPVLSALLRKDSSFNPVRPLPPVGGNPALHGIEPQEADVFMDLRERVGHTLVMGTTRVGKTRLAELLITQDIRRGEVVIVFDPKGDADLLRRIWAEAHRAGRGNELSLFHLGWPEISARYNAVGRFGRVVSSLAAAGVMARRQNGGQIHNWLLRHFNPAPDWGMTNADFYRAVSYETPTQLDLPLNTDFAESLWFTPPVSDPDAGVWWFDGLPHKAVPVERLRRPPEPGMLTGEVKRGDNINTLMDMMPEGTVVSLTIVAQAQDRLEEDFTRLAKNAVGENTESLRVRQDVQEVKALLGRRHKLYRRALTFLVRGKDVFDLDHRVHQLSSTLLTAGLQPVRPEFSVSPLNAYLRALPMCFNPQKDKKHWYSRLTWVQHLAGLLPVTGRSTGTGHPGFSFFNRGGAPLTFDPMNKQDRTQNAHLLLFGPTGAGKSATLCASLIQLMAIHRPRLFIVEAGNSFGLLAYYYESLGLTVNKIGIKPGCGVSLALFADAHQLLQLSPKQLRIHEADIPDTDEQPEEEGDKQRDILGEMEIAARLMITGGEKREEERLTRSDRGLIREAIMQAAQTSFEESRQMVASDLQNALYAIARHHQLDEHGQPLITAHRRARADEMASAMSMFTQGFEGELFNRPGTPWCR